MNENVLIIFLLFCPFTDIKLRFCDVPSAGSCCNVATELKMANSYKTAMDRNARDAISKMSSTLSTRATKYQGEL